MLSSNWRKGLTFGLAATAALVLVGFSYTQYRSAISEQASIELSAHQQARIQDDQAAAEIERRCQSIAATSERINCEQQAQEQAEASKGEIRDLEAQRTMALWTRYMGLAAIIGITVGIIGVGLLWITFQATRRAADSAGKTYNAFIAVERAKLVVSLEEVEARSDGSATVEIVVINIGKAPCVVNRACFKWRKTNAFSEIKGYMAPERADFVAGGAKVNLGYANRPIGEGHSEFIGGVIAYTSPFASEHKSFFCFRIACDAKEAEVQPFSNQKGADWPADT